MNNPRNKQLISFKLHAILSVMMKTCAILLHHIQDSQPSTLSAPAIQPSTQSWLDDPRSIEADDPPDIL